MTKKQYEEKYSKIVNWCSVELNKKTKRLKKENKLIGLDTNKEEYEPIYAEYKEKLRKLKEEYEASTNK